MKNEIILENTIHKKILTIRNIQVIIDADLAELYNVPTKVLNQAVKRNLLRFPEDFMFQLNKQEKDQVVTNCDHLNKLKFSTKLPFAFTEHGIAMLSSVLNSEKAIRINIQIIRTFIKMKKMILSYKDMQYIIKKIENDLKSNRNKIIKNKDNIEVIANIVQTLIEKPKPKKKYKIGFKPD